MKKRIRIKDIAEKSGVSVGTVDRVIHKRGNVDEEVRQKVLKVMEELDYQPNILARTLANNRVFQIAVLLPDYRTDPYWVAPQKGVERAYQTVQHYGVVIQFYYFDLNNPDSFVEKSNELLHHLPDAVLIAPIFRNEALPFLQNLAELKIPCALINTDMDEVEKLCYIGQDSYQSGVLAARLLSAGLQEGDQIVILHMEPGVKNAIHLINKETGFRDYVKRNHTPVELITYEFEQFQHKFSTCSFVDHIVEALPRLKGIFITSSRAYRIAECLGAKHPHLTLLGYDLIEKNIQYLKENKIQFLINQNPEKQGYFGVTNLVNHLILNKEVAKEQYLPLDIIVAENASYYLSEIWV